MLVGEGPPGVGAKAAAVLRTIEGLCRARGREAAAARTGKIFFAGKYAVAEPAVDPENFVVSKARLKDEFRDDVRRRVEGIAGSRRTSGDGVAASSGVVDSGASRDAIVVEAATCAGGAYQEIGRVAMSGD